MSDRDLVDRFSSEVDQFIQTGTLADNVERVTKEYAEALLIAQTLSSIDFSSETNQQQIIRNQLFVGIETRKGWLQNLKEKVSMNTLFQMRDIKPALSVTILVVLLSVLFTNLIFPGSVAAAANRAVSFIQRLWVGEHTSIDPIDPDQIIKLEDGSLIMQGEYSDNGSVTGNVPNFESSAVTVFERRQFKSLAEAQTIVHFQLVQPGFLPENYAFSHVTVIGEGDFTTVNLHYTGPSGNLMLSQRPIGDQPNQTISIGLPDDYVIETVSLNGQSATWAKHVLMWEADGVSYLLSSPDLDQSTAILIAESLE
jgi:hypothetical protein